ncbi:MAG TPA: hypothetical protein VFW86_01790, partial [Candidatus Limnocylindrales bacterium]|nr:hypothetical protein [Candidatus Limnocylindrales bacterium]
MAGIAARTSEERLRLVRLPESGPLAPQAPTPCLVEAPIVAAEQMTAEYWRLVLEAPGIASRGCPGQFAMLTIPPPGEIAPVLPRPMAIYAFDDVAGTIEIVYRIVGEGTRRLTARRSGDAMTVVGPLGRGFVLPPGARRILLLGRGIGTCSLT